ncbi:hypothetical protein LR48_Vigan538s000900 [Vigna angularis]|uniref:Uncharacterized protein n=1 Tax=Phaseolus angularis TaxID=3914 RepID=A0A0L9TD90_PHAAN|nr:hypothetical protein LR48_Vigan538s000900 [Vigna angularis]
MLLPQISQISQKLNSLPLLVKLTLDLGSRLWWRSAGSTLRFDDASFVVWTLTEREFVALRQFEAVVVADADDVKWCWFGDLVWDWAADVVVEDVKAEKEAKGRISAAESRWRSHCGRDRGVRGRCSLRGGKRYRLSSFHGGRGSRGTLVGERINWTTEVEGREEEAHHSAVWGALKAEPRDRAGVDSDPIREKVVVGVGLKMKLGKDRSLSIANCYCKRL